MNRVATAADRRAGVRARAPRLALTLQYATPRRGLPARASVEAWTRAALERPASLTIRFVGAAEGRRLNRAYRDSDHATNVLTFVYGETPELAGDIVVCAPIVAREARAQRKARIAHFAHLVVHGVLHLQGHDHLKDAEARRMESREKAILAGLGYPDPYSTNPPPAEPARARREPPASRTPAPRHGRRA